MTAAGLHILQHALGLDEFGRGQSYRTHFVTGPGSDNYDTCMTLVAGGLMTRRAGSTLPFGGDDLFHATNTGRRYVAENSPEPPPRPKLTRSQARYQRYLDADSGLSFREWLSYDREPRTSARNHNAPAGEDMCEVPF